VKVQVVPLSNEWQNKIDREKEGSMLCLLFLNDSATISKSGLVNSSKFKTNIALPNKSFIGIYFPSYLTGQNQCHPSHCLKNIIRYFATNWKSFKIHLHGLRLSSLGKKDPDSFMKGVGREW
jgi:hypothetical protein